MQTEKTKQRTVSYVEFLPEYGHAVIRKKDYEDY